MENLETDLYVYCGDTILLRKLQRLVFVEDAGELKFSMNQLLPLPSWYSGIPNYQIYGHHWREIVWGVSQDGKEIGKDINNNSFLVSIFTPWLPVLKWFITFCKMSERLYQDCEIVPKPELVIFYAYGIFGTRDQGFSLWEPAKELVLHDTFQEHWLPRLKQLFNSRRIDYYVSDTWE